MRLSRVYARFYKSFNYDHVRKATTGAKSRGDWEMVGDKWYPYVEVPLDGKITAVVGANESGKSHLLSAVEKAITGRGISLRDICRYSDVFGVKRGDNSWPHVGVAWSSVTEDESSRIRELSGGSGTFKEFMMFRTAPDIIELWLPEKTGHVRYILDAKRSAALRDDILPAPFTINAEVALPGSVPFAWLCNPGTYSPPKSDRRERAATLDMMRQLGSMVTDLKSVTNNADRLHGILAPVAELQRRQPAEANDEQIELTRELLFGLANIEPKTFIELREAIAEEHEGYANALTQEINAQIERSLNFRRWWVQDRDFSLRISPREHEVVLTIRDRTGTEYTFDERSSGLKYFLSYLIQSQANRGDDKKQHILLMDEPDAHLSAEAQQDLLRVFADLADPFDGTPAVQVLYVTHSPFLLDKNHAQRLRVLEKGRGIDGTRVISNAAQNHYEPLRSAFGSFVGETAFVGSVNLLVEGPADQILMAAAARAIRAMPIHLENETLDLNRMVIVPCGGASQVPYMTFLIRGRDADKPPVVALLDSDKAGNDAAKLMRNDYKFRKLIKPDFILQVGDVVGLADPTIELEDLIPMPLALAAVNAYLVESQRFRDGDLPQLAEADIPRSKTSLFDRLDLACQAKDRGLAKVPFARAIVALVEEDADGDLKGAISDWLAQMRVLFRRINELRKQAEEGAARKKLSALVDQRVQIFLTDNAAGATREQVSNLFEHIEAQLDESNEADEFRAKMRELTGAYRLADDPSKPVGDFEALRVHLVALQHAMSTNEAARKRARKDKAEAKGQTAARTTKAAQGPGPGKRKPSKPRTPKAAKPPAVTAEAIIAAEPPAPEVVAADVET